MLEMLYVFLLCACLGGLVGVLAGLLGIGGGLLVVPFLMFLLPYFEIATPEKAVVVAIATSLATIIFTSYSSCLAHHRKDNVPWEFAPWIMSGVALGAALVGVFASQVNAEWLKNIFAVAVVFIAIRMATSKTVIHTDKTLPPGPVIVLIGTVLGGMSSLVGIGGGALIVPTLNYFGVDIRRAIGAAAACGFAIAIFGSAGFIYSGWEQTNWQTGYLGYVFLPAVFGVIITSMLTAPIGARLVQTMPIKKLKRIFAVLLSIIALKMIFS
ncbi:sulfite exporter TauE/SafE family protein [Flocculibacter collagenilyticus]|uniref:sulfite exporter TauE/SafE family protein n=1 Tax=Flocculibacter collagenilyticus TaxID=2744479 RepID=UPI0018F2C6E3|nr:sulfite exporter TauE/SafE family protein [Flocculibacter collagenilyticus]